MLALAIVLGWIAWRLHLDGDRPGAALLGLGAAAFLAAVVWAALGPVLELDEAGVRIRSGIRAKSYSWQVVDTLKASTHRRRGLSQHNLELEVGDELIVLPDWLLGGRLDQLVSEAGRLRS